jgi:hypothetical protein
MGIKVKYSFNDVSLDFDGGSVGFFDDDKYPTGETVPAVAAVNNFGGKDTPPRPFMTKAAEQIAQEMDKVARIVRSGIESGNAAMVNDRIGAFASQHVRKQITSGQWTANSKETIARKKSSKPLIDTGLMRNSVRWKVKK